mgnify:CR=1 FL=1
MALGVLVRLLASFQDPEGLIIRALGCLIRPLGALNGPEVPYKALGSLVRPLGEGPGIPIGSPGTIKRQL